MSALGKTFRLTAEGLRRHGFSTKTRLVCVEDGENAGVFRTLRADNGEQWGVRWIFRWDAVVRDEPPGGDTCFDGAFDGEGS